MPKDRCTTKQIFLDNEIIEGMWGLKRTYYPVTKYAASPILCGEHPWEQGGVRLWGTVLRDESVFRMWYQGQGEKTSFTCYATSVDGLQWERPSLGICAFDGSTENNTVFRGDGRASGISVVRDDADHQLAARSAARPGPDLSLSRTTCAPCDTSRTGSR